MGNVDVATMTGTTMIQIRGVLAGGTRTTRGRPGAMMTAGPADAAITTMMTTRLVVEADAAT